jgi:Zn-dependent protease
MNNLSTIQNIAVWILPILFAVTLHEVAHGWVASKLGDKTALMLGRLSLNPIKHIDLVGTIIVPLVCLLAGGFVFGWAKPVPVNWRNLRNPRRDGALVAAAGPLSNLFMAILWALITKIGYLILKGGFEGGVFVVYVGHAGIMINLLLMILNLFPLPPLDGSRVVSSLLPRKLANIYESIEPYGFFILLALLLTGILPALLAPSIEFMQNLFMITFSL